MTTDLGISDLAVTATTITDAAHDYYLISNRKICALRNQIANLIDSTCNFVSRGQRKFHGSVLLEISIQKLYISPAHAGSANFHQYFISCDIRGFDFFKDE